MTTKHCPLVNRQLVPENMWQRIGFMRFASEYWLLARLIVQRISDIAHENELPSTADYVKAPFEEANEPSPTLLERYDETSMRQVNDLIADFQKVGL